MGKSAQQIIANARDALHDDEIEYGAILTQWERGQEVATVDLVSALAWRVQNQRRELAKINEKNARLREARELLLHFQFIAHGPACICAMCERRTAFLASTSTSTGEAGG